MSVSSLHVFQQGPVLAALGKTALSALRGPSAADAPIACPGPWIEANLPPRPADLVADYIRHVGGDPAWYRGRVPAHFFHQWGFAMAARTLVGAPYPLTKVMNGGCRIEQRAPLPLGEPLRVRARLESIEDDGKKAILTQTVVTGTRGADEAVVAQIRAIVPLKRAEDGGGNGGQKAPPHAKKARPTVPSDVREIAFFKVGEGEGLDFAKLSGDFNPIHWVPAYARASGFRACILHGFSTLARAVEAVNRRVFSGDVSRLTAVDVRFTRPLVLPARVGVYVGDGGALFVGDAPGGGAYLEGAFVARASGSSSTEAPHE